MTRLKRAQEELPGWTVTSSHLRDGVLEASQPGGGVFVRAGTVEDLVAEVRAVVRIQEVARVLFADAPLALSDEHWPETVSQLHQLRAQNSYYRPLKVPVGVPPTQAQMDLVQEAAQMTSVRPPPPRVVQDNPKLQGYRARLSLGSAVQRELDAKAKGYTGIPCDQCGGLETVRIGKCLRCESCGSSGECG